MAERKTLIQKMKMPPGQKAKEKLDEWIHENVNLPLHQKGMTDTGAALSAALSATGELLIPDDLADAAMALIPGAKLAKAGKKGLKALKKLEDQPEAARALNYQDIEKGVRQKAQKKREEIGKAADTLEYGPRGEIVRKRADEDTMWDELRRREKRRKDKN